MKRAGLGVFLVAVTLALAGCPATPAGVLEIPNLRYAATPGVDANLQSLDIYLPDPAPASPMPVVIWVHGGGWRKGDKTNQMQYKPPLFTGAGYCMASVNYRLSPDPVELENEDRVMHPTHVQDLATAIAWVHGNIASYGGDPNRMALLGHSAGGHLVSLVSTDESYLASHGLPLTVLRGTCVLDAASYDITLSMNNEPRDIYPNAFGYDTAVWAGASPVEHAESGKGIPPFLLIIQGTAFRVNMCYGFAAALTGTATEATVLEAHEYDHEGVNQAVGYPGDTIVTPPLMAFMADVLETPEP